MFIPVTNDESPPQVSVPHGPTNADAINIVKNEQLLKMQWWNETCTAHLTHSCNGQTAATFASCTGGRM